MEQSIKESDVKVCEKLNSNLEQNQEKLKKRNKPNLPFLVISKSSSESSSEFLNKNPISYAPTTEYPPL